MGFFTILYYDIIFIYILVRIIIFVQITLGSVKKINNVIEYILGNTKKGKEKKQLLAQLLFNEPKLVRLRTSLKVGGLLALS